LEPSAGDGVFIDKLLELEPSLCIEALDRNERAIEILNRKYGTNPNIKIRLADTLFDEELDMHVLNGGEFDRIIGNPPYGGWLDYDVRERLKRKYKGHYVKETYSLFLLRCTSLLKSEGKLTFIVPDTFLFLHRHSLLRKYLLTNSKIIEIITFPSNLFPGVQFGYSNLCIITLQKTELRNQALEHEVRFITGIKTEKDLVAINHNEYGKYNLNLLKQQDVYDNPDHAFLVNSNKQIPRIIQEHSLTLGDIADCVTGLYVGDNRRFLKVASHSVKNSKNYDVIKENEIATDYLEHENLLEGLPGNQYIPIVKGSPQNRYLRSKSLWYVNWSTEAVNHYKSDKKARFQNSQFYFKDGIALPMVKSSNIRATLMSGMVFDQSIVGVFPRDRKLLFYLLALLNSKTIRDIITTINPSANNSANYIKKVPIIMPEDETLDRISSHVKTIIEHLKCDKFQLADAIHTQVEIEIEEIYFPN